MGREVCRPKYKFFCLEQTQKKNFEMNEAQLRRLHGYKKSLIMELKVLTMELKVSSSISSLVFYIPSVILWTYFRKFLSKCVKVEIRMIPSSSYGLTENVWVAQSSLHQRLLFLNRQFKNCIEKYTLFNNDSLLINGKSLMLSKV